MRSKDGWWCEHKPAAVTWVQFPNLVLHLGGVCLFVDDFPPCSEGFLQVP